MSIGLLNAGFVQEKEPGPGKSESSILCSASRGGLNPSATLSKDKTLCRFRHCPGILMQRLSLFGRSFLRPSAWIPAYARMTENRSFVVELIKNNRESILKAKGEFSVRSF
jgi:hypothetical protein